MKLIPSYGFIIFWQSGQNLIPLILLSIKYLLRIPLIILFNEIWSLDIKLISARMV